MSDFALQFRGVASAALVSALAVSIAAAVLGCGVWRMAAGRRRGGAVIAAVGAAGLAAAVLAAVRVPVTGTAGRALWLVLLAGLVAGAVAVFYSTVYAYLGRNRIAGLLALRGLAVLALLLILFKPAVSVQPSRRDARLSLPVLVDRSASMATIDHPDLPDRYRQATAALSAQGERMKRLFRVGWYHFARQVQEVGDLSELAELSPSGADTDTTDIAGAIRRSAAGFSAAELAGIVVLSDGLHNAGGDVLAAAGESPVPIYAIGVGGRSETASGQRNLRLVSVDAPLEAVQDNVTTLTAHVRLTGWANIPARVVLAEGDKEVDSRPLLPDSNAQTMPVELKWTPPEPPAGAAGADIRKLRVLIEPNPAEATADDNAAEVHVLVTTPKVRLLYVEGTLRPEYKYLRRVLATDPNIKSISLVRIAENRFLSQGHIDGKQLADLPRTDEEFGYFDVIILGDLDRTFLTNDQMERVRRFVEGGKAVLMLGGRNSFGPGGYANTPVETALPVLCGGRGQEQEPTPFVPQLTAAGAASPIFADLARHFGGPSAKAADPVPELLGCVQVPQAKPGATVLAIHPTRGNAAGPLTVLAVHNFGTGRAGAFTADTTWKWQMHLAPLGANSPYYKFWGQLVRWLAGVEQKQKVAGPSVLARMGTGYLRQGDEVKVTAQVRGADGQPAGEAAVSVTLRATPAEKGAQEPLRATATRGLYQATLRPDKPGSFTATVTAADGAGKPLGGDELRLLVAPHTKETDRLARDEKTLTGIAAAQREGRYAELSALPDVLDEIIRRQRDLLPPPPPQRVYSLYNFTLLFFVFVALLTCEWLLRRRWQLR